MRAVCQGIREDGREMKIKLSVEDAIRSLEGRIVLYLAE